MPKSITHNFGLDYDTEEIKDAKLTMCKPVIDEKSGEVFLYLIYRYVDKVGNRRELTIPRVKLPLRSDQIPSIRIDETFALPSMREYSYYIRLQDNQLPICPFEGFSTSVDMTEVKDPCIIERVIEYAVKEMTQEEIEQKLGYKVKIVTDKEEK